MQYMAKEQTLFSKKAKLKTRLSTLSKAVLSSLLVSSTLLGGVTTAQAGGVLGERYSTVKMPNAEFVERVIDLRVKVLGGEVKFERTWTDGSWHMNEAWSNLAFYHNEPKPDFTTWNSSSRSSTGRHEIIIVPDNREEEDKDFTYVGRAGTIFELTDDNDVEDENSSGSGNIAAKNTRSDKHIVNNGDDDDDKNKIKIYAEINKGQSFLMRSKDGWIWYDREGNKAIYDKKGRLLAYSDRNGITVKFVLDDSGRRMGVMDHHGNVVLAFAYDDEKLVSVTDNAGRKVLYHWDGHRMIGVTDVEGNLWTYGYDKNRDLILCTQPDGSSTVLTVKGEAKEKEDTQFNSQKDALHIYPERKSLTSGDGSGGAFGGGFKQVGGAAKVSKILIPMKRKTTPKPARVGSIMSTNGATTLFNVMHNKPAKEYTVTSVDELGKSTVEVYDNAGQLLTRSVNGDLVLKREYSSSRYVKETDERGLSSSVSYNEAGKPTQITHPNGSVETYTYDNTFNQPLTYTNQLGVVTQWTYDDKGNALTRIDAVGKPEQRFNAWTYDEYGQALTYTIAQGGGADGDAITIHFTYDANGNIKTITDALGNTTQYAYNNQGLTTRVTNALGNTWQYVYTPKGHIKTVTNPLGESISYEMGSIGRPIKMTDAKGISSTVDYSYHNKGMVVTVTNVLGNVTVYQFDPQYNLTQITLPSGDMAQQVFDAKGRPEQLIDPTGNIVQMTHGVAGTLQAGMPMIITSPTYQVSYEYNALGLPTEIKQQFNDGQELTTRISYNALGMLLSSTTPNGATTQLQYDAFGNRTRYTDALGGQTRQTYDILGNVTSVVDAKGNVHSFEYDKNGNLVKEITPSGQVTAYAYDAAGKMVQRQDAVGNITQYEYNAAGLVVKEIVIAAGQSTPEQIVTYAYDKNGLLLEVSKNSVTVNSLTHDVNTRHVFTRDEMARVVREDIGYINGGSTISKTLRYAYDANGRTVSITYPDGSVQTATYEQGRLKQIQRPDGQLIAQGAYEWLRPGEVNIAGVKQTLTYDALQRTTGIDVKNSANNSLMQRAYTYDAAGNIVKRDTEEGEYTYGYDLLDRIKQATPPEAAQQKGLPVESYAYDAVHNRIGSSHQAGEWLYNQDNQLLKFGSGMDEASYTYTANGHVATETKGGVTKAYTYDATDRLVCITNTTGGRETEIARYAYDPFGRRISKTVHGATTYFIYSPEGLIVELNEGGDMTRAYGWQPDSMYGTAPLWQAEVGADGKVSTAQFHTLVTNHLGTPQLAVSKDGEVTWKGSMEAFGQTLPDAENQITMNLRFPGQYYDEETNTHYNYFRDYNPNTGRYLQKDPIGLNGGINVYAYAKANALGKYDPYGLAFCTYIISTHTLSCRAEKRTCDPNGICGREERTLDPDYVFSGGGSVDQYFQESDEDYANRQAHRNNPNLSNVPNLGSIWPGRYRMVRTPPSRSDGIADYYLKNDELLPFFGNITHILGLARSGARIHIGSVSLGCITVYDNIIDQYEQLMDMLKRDEDAGFRNVLHVHATPEDMNNSKNADELWW